MLLSLEGQLSTIGWGGDPVGRKVAWPNLTVPSWDMTYYLLAEV